MKKKVVIPIVVLLAFIVWGIRVYEVNAGVAKSYEIKSYKIGNPIALDNAVLKVQKVKFGKISTQHNFTSFPVKVTMQVQNTSQKKISITSIVAAKLAYGMDVYQTNEGNFNIGKIKQFPPESSTYITLLYHVKPKDKGKKPKLYLSQDLYGKRVKEVYNKGKRLGIAVQL